MCNVTLPCGDIGCDMQCLDLQHGEEKLRVENHFLFAEGLREHARSRENESSPVRPMPDMSGASHHSKVNRILVTKYILEMFSTTMKPAEYQCTASRKRPTVQTSGLPRIKADKKILTKTLLGAPGLTTRSKGAPRGSWPYY